MVEGQAAGMGHQSPGCLMYLLVLVAARLAAAPVSMAVLVTWASDKYADAHVSKSAREAVAAASLAATNKTSKYCQLYTSSLQWPFRQLVPGTIKQLVQELGR